MICVHLKHALMLLAVDCMADGDPPIAIWVGQVLDAMPQDMARAADDQAATMGAWDLDAMLYDDPGDDADNHAVRAALLWAYDYQVGGVS